MTKEVSKAIGKFVLQIILVVGTMHCLIGLLSLMFGISVEWLESSNPFGSFLVAILVSFGWMRVIKWAFPEPNDEDNNKEER